jgi:LysR family transcriptional regulator, glycine cleavage system transcriptional activator
MNQTLPSFPAIRAFEAAARCLSFKAAALELNVTQSAISHRIKSLEEFLGVALFRRGVRGVALTSAGATYLADVSSVIAMLISATDDVRKRDAAGPLYIRTTPAFASRWLVPRLSDFHRIHPKIELHIGTSIEPPNFAEDGIDLNIRYGEVACTDLHAEPFLESVRFPVVSPDLLAASAPVTIPADLSRFVLLHDEVGDAWRVWFANANVKDMDVDTGPRFEHCDLLLEAAARGQGVALAFGALAQSDLANGTLVRLFDIDLPSTIIYSLVCPKASLGRPKVAAFRNWLMNARKQETLPQSAATRMVAKARAPAKPSTRAHHLRYGVR